MALVRCSVPRAGVLHDLLLGGCTHAHNSQDRGPAGFAFGVLDACDETVLPAFDGNLDLPAILFQQSVSLPAAWWSLPRLLHTNQLTSPSP